MAENDDLVPKKCRISLDFGTTCFALLNTPYIQNLSRMLNTVTIRLFSVMTAILNGPLDSVSPIHAIRNMLPNPTGTTLDD